MICKFRHSPSLLQSTKLIFKCFFMRKKFEIGNFYLYICYWFKSEKNVHYAYLHYYYSYSYYSILFVKSIPCNSKLLCILKFVWKKLFCLCICDLLMRWNRFVSRYKKNCFHPFKKRIIYNTNYEIYILTSKKKNEMKNDKNIEK